jgi:hypothetical protein
LGGLFGTKTAAGFVSANWETKSLQQWRNKDIKLYLIDYDAELRLKPLSAATGGLIGPAAAFAYYFRLSPDDFVDSRPARSTAVQTRGGIWIDDFGPGVREITMQGHTGFKKRREPHSNATIDGKQSFTKLNSLVETYRRERRKRFEDGRDPRLLIMVLEVPADPDLQMSIVIHPSLFRILRSNKDPLKYTYDFKFIVCGEVKDFTTQLGDQLAKALSNKLARTTTAIKNADKQLQSLTNTYTIHPELLTPEAQQTMSKLSIVISRETSDPEVAKIAEQLKQLKGSADPTILEYDKTSNQASNDTWNAQAFQTQKALEAAKAVWGSNSKTNQAEASINNTLGLNSLGLGIQPGQELNKSILAANTEPTSASFSTSVKFEEAKLGVEGSTYSELVSQQLKGPNTYSSGQVGPQSILNLKSNNLSLNTGLDNLTAVSSASEIASKVYSNKSENINKDSATLAKEASSSIPSIKQALQQSILDHGTATLDYTSLAQNTSRTWSEVQRSIAALIPTVEAAKVLGIDKLNNRADTVVSMVEGDIRTFILQHSNYKKYGNILGIYGGIGGTGNPGIKIEALNWSSPRHSANPLGYDRSRYKVTFFNAMERGFLPSGVQVQGHQILSPLDAEGRDVATINQGKLIAVTSEALLNHIDILGQTLYSGVIDKSYKDRFLTQWVNLALRLKDGEDVWSSLEGLYRDCILKVSKETTNSLQGFNSMLQRVGGSTIIDGDLNTYPDAPEL